MATVHDGKDDNASSQAAIVDDDFTPVEQRDEAIEFAERKDLKYASMFTLPKQD